MFGSERGRIITELRNQMSVAREEFDAARAELSRACTVVPDISSADRAVISDAALMRQMATRRYKCAEHAYGELLKRFAAAVHDLRLIDESEHEDGAHPDLASVVGQDYEVR